MKDAEKKRDPWTDPDPQPGDFDEYLDEMEWDEFEVDPDFEIRLVSDEELARRVGREQAKRLGIDYVFESDEATEPAKR
jgi:hypothetical protein